MRALFTCLALFIGLVAAGCGSESQTTPTGESVSLEPMTRDLQDFDAKIAAFTRASEDCVASPRRGCARDARAELAAEANGAYESMAEIQPSLGDSCSREIDAIRSSMERIVDSVRMEEEALDTDELSPDDLKAVVEQTERRTLATDRLTDSIFAFNEAASVDCD